MSQTAEHPPQPSPTEGEAVAGNDRRRLALLIAVVVGVIVLSLITGAFPAVAFVLAIIASVLIHEAGHLFAARKTGMKATEYFVGFGPRLWSIKRGETEYGVKAIPAGGYVKVLGMNNMDKGVAPEDEPRTYRQASYPKKLLMTAAGIFTHFVVAFLLLVLMWTVIGVPNASRPTLEIGSISELEDGPSPAQQAGFRLGDEIVSVDGRAVTTWRELPPYIRERPGQPITFVVERDGRQVTLSATPINGNPEGEQVGFVGIGAKTEVERVNPLVAAGRSAEGVYQLTVGSVKALGSFFAPGSLRNYGDQLTGGPDADPDARPVSVVGVTRIANEAGLFDFFALLIMLNIFFGVFNAIPLPPLDGGHIALATYERIRSRKGKRYEADVQKLLPVAAVVLVALVALGASAVLMDIVNPIANPFQ